MSLLAPADRAALEKDPKKASEAVESLLLQRMLSSCHLMGNSKAPGAGMRQDLFVEALSDAVTKNGGIGLAQQIAGAAHPAPTGTAAQGAIPLAHANNSLPLKPVGSGTDLETELLTHKLSLIGIANRADKHLGEP